MHWWGFKGWDLVGGGHQFFSEKHFLFAIVFHENLFCCYLLELLFCFHSIFFIKENNPSSVLVTQSYLI